MKTSLKQGLAVLLSVMALHLSAYDFKEGNLAYNIIGDGTEVEVAQSSNGEGTVVIPDAVEHDGTTYAVTAIGNRAFSSQYDLTGVKLPETITRIGSYAFYFTRLSSINMPEAITEIGDFAFSETHLSALRLPPRVTTIATSLYYNCPKLEEVAIPAHVTAIGANAFAMCANLKSVTMSDGMVDIGNGAFSGCTSLAEVVLPESLAAIGDGAFSDCTSLAEIDLPESIAAIGNAAFRNTPWLAAMTGKGLIYIGRVAFKYVGTVPSSVPLEIADGTLGIAGGAFSDCKTLTAISLPASLTHIGTMAFSNTGLTTIDIPQSVTSIGGGAFSGCDKLIEIEIPDGVTTINGALFSHCTSLSRVKLPKAFTSLGAQVFYGTQLRHVSLPATLRTMSSDAFYSSNILSLSLVGEGEFDVTLTAGDRAYYGWRLDRVRTLVVEPGVKRLPDIEELNPSAVICLGTTPPDFDKTFAGYGAALHVPQDAMAEYFVHEGWSKFANLNNDAVPLTTLAFGQDAITIEKGNSVTLVPTVEPASIYGPTINYTTTNKAVATVSATGEVTAVGVGECDIVAHCLDKIAVCHINVPYPDFSISLSKSEAILDANLSEFLLNIKLSNYQQGMIVSVRSTDPEIAAVAGRYSQSDGSVTAAKIVAKAFGECDIVVTCGGRQSVCHIIVPDGIALERGQAIVSAGKMVTILPTVVPLGCELKAASADNAVAMARVSDGKVQVLGLAPGMVAVSVTDANGVARPVDCNVVVVGDMNGDAEVNVGDVNLLLDAILNQQSVSDTLDCNHDKAIDVGDVNVILQAILESEDIR
ncbi:MAG: leucine-rich repeat protein [Muribaculaceae bacterium]|nr:leucine-rich repeat protein [Muribaculaceae bacterium]